MDLIFENKQRNIKAYKNYNVIQKTSNIGNILLNGLIHWDTISDEEVQNIKNIKTLLYIVQNARTNNSIGFKGYTITDAIVMQNDVKDIHYYAYFNENNIELWYITGVYDMVMCDDRIKLNDLFHNVP